MSKMFKNIRKKNKGAISLLVTYTVLMFVVILVGVYSAVLANAKSQLKSNIRIQEIYGESVERVGVIYDKLASKWEQNEKVNKPVLLAGMEPIRYTLPTVDTKGEIFITTAEDDEWYNYDEKKWANAKTEDGSMWVWIPRFAYRINEIEEKIEIVFLEGRTEIYYDENGEQKSAKHSNAQDLTSEDFIIHPAFADESENSYLNGRMG